MGRGSRRWQRGAERGKRCRGRCKRRCPCIRPLHASHKPMPMCRMGKKGPMSTLLLFLACLVFPWGRLFILKSYSQSCCLRSLNENAFRGAYPGVSWVPTEALHSRMHGPFSNQPAESFIDGPQPMPVNHSTWERTRRRRINIEYSCAFSGSKTLVATAAPESNDACLFSALMLGNIIATSQ